MNLAAESRIRLALLAESIDADELGPIDRLCLRHRSAGRNVVRSGRVETTAGNEALSKVRDVVRR